MRLHTCMQTLGHLQFSSERLGESASRERKFQNNKHSTDGSGWPLNLHFQAIKRLPGASLNPSSHPITVPRTTGRATASSAPRMGRVWKGHHDPRSPGRPLLVPLWSGTESWWSPAWPLQTHRCYSCWTLNHTLKWKREGEEWFVLCN